jgi:SM-20-related protein
MDVVDLDALRSAPVSADPFAHILLPRFVKAEALPQVFAALPPMKGRGSFPIEAVRLGPPAKAVIAGLQSEAFREIVEEKFNLDLAGAPNMVTLRGNSGTQDGQIHTDSRAKRVTILLYLNPAGAESWAKQQGCLRLLRGPDNLENYAAGMGIRPLPGSAMWCR